eukprot:Skav234877  [mRNA]  locus=scaffold840:359148:359639:- [translate_table: standard]
MSFAQRLGQHVRAAQVEWVEAIMQKFMAQCEEAAKRGQCQQNLLYNELCDSASTDSALNLLNQRLSELGLAHARAEQINHTLHGICVQVRANWEPGPDVPEKTGIAPKGTKGNCPICHENRHMVALMPCGHTVCQQCQRSQQLRQCPMCRKNSTGATEALFMG